MHIDLVKEVLCKSIEVPVDIDPKMIHLVFSYDDSRSEPSAVIAKRSLWSITLEAKNENNFDPSHIKFLLSHEISHLLSDANLLLEMQGFMDLDENCDVEERKKEFYKIHTQHKSKEIEKKADFFAYSHYPADTIKYMEFMISKNIPHCDVLYPSWQERLDHLRNS